MIHEHIYLSKLFIHLRSVYDKYILPQLKNKVWGFKKDKETSQPSLLPFEGLLPKHQSIISYVYRNIYMYIPICKVECEIKYNSHIT